MRTRLFSFVTPKDHQRLQFGSARHFTSGFYVSLAGRFRPAGGCSCKGEGETVPPEITSGDSGKEEAEHLTSSLSRVECWQEKFGTD